MRKYLIAMIALTNGSFFLGSGLLQHNDVASIAGVLLTAIGALGVRDWFQQAMRSGALAVVVPQIKENIRDEGERAQAFYQLYRMAPQVIENQTQIMQLTEHFRKFELALQELKEQAAASLPEGFDSARVSEEKSVRDRVAFVAYAEAEHTDLMSTLKALQMEALIVGNSERTLLVSDIGLGELGLAELANYVQGNIEIEYWISKKIAFGADLLLISGEHMAREADLVLQALKKLRDAYDQVIVVASARSVRALEAAALPATKQVVEVAIDSKPNHIRDSKKVPRV